MLKIFIMAFILCRYPNHQAGRWQPGI